MAERVFPDPYEHVRGTVHDPAREQDSPIPGVSSRASDEQFTTVTRESGDDSAVTSYPRRGRGRRRQTRDS